jgi:hypothetical protein
VTRKTLNPDWLAISKRTACSYGAIEYFAARCAYYQVSVPDGATIEKLIVANRAAQGDTRARDYGDVCRLEFEQHLERCVLVLAKRDKNEGRAEWVVPEEPRQWTLF